MSLGSPRVPRTQGPKDYAFIALKVFPWTAIFGAVGYSSCSAIPNLALAMVIFGAMNMVIGLVSLWYNIPDDMKEKDKIVRSFTSNVRKMESMVQQQRSKHRANLLRKLQLRKQKHKAAAKGTAAAGGGKPSAGSGGKPSVWASIANDALTKT